MDTIKIPNKCMDLNSIKKANNSCLKLNQIILAYVGLIKI